MFIFNRYVKSFNFKNNLFYYNNRFIDYNYNSKNNIIHSSLFIVSISLYFYFFIPIVYKDSLKNFLNFNSFLFFLLSRKSVSKTNNNTNITN
jgi:hypothetical protein